VLIVLLVGIALARPLPASRKKPVATIALLDLSPGVDSAAARLAFIRLSPAADTMLPMLDFTDGLVRARRTAGWLSPRADSVNLVIVSSFTEGLWDAATPQVRAQWPGHIELARVARMPAAVPKAEIDAGADDAVTAALERLGRRAARGSVLVRRLGVTTNDRTRVAAEGGVLVQWPKFRELHDTAFGVYAAGGVALIGPFPRATPFEQAPIMLYADGQSGAIERPLGKGCEREVGFSIDAGDMALRPAGLLLIERLIAPCGAGWTPERYESLDSTRLAVLAGAGSLATAKALRSDGPRPPSGFFLLLIGLMLVAERLVRRRPRS
jgi:hypothetical protein